MSALSVGVAMKEVLYGWYSVGIAMTEVVYDWYSDDNSMLLQVQESGVYLGPVVY